MIENLSMFIRQHLFALKVSLALVPALLLPIWC